MSNANTIKVNAWCNKLPKVGRINLTYALTSAGTTRTEYTIVRNGENDYYLVSAGAWHAYDEDFLYKAIAEKEEEFGRINAEDVTQKWGVFAIAGGALYRWNGLRGIQHTARSPALASQHRLPSAIPVITGVLLVAGRPWGQTLNASAELQLAVVLATAALCAAFAYADYLIWNRASAEPGRFDAVD